MKLPADPPPLSWLPADPAMNLPVEPVHPADPELLAELQVGCGHAAENGPSAVIEYLRSFLERPGPSLEVRAAAYERLAEAQAELEDWEGCAASMAAAQRLADGGVAAPPVRKLCRDCGRDVTHRPRQKNQATGEYLCLACLRRHEPQPMPGLGRGGIWLLLLALAALLVFVVATFLLFDRR